MHSLYRISNENSRFRYQPFQLILSFCPRRLKHIFHGILMTNSENQTESKNQTCHIEKCFDFNRIAWFWKFHSILLPISWCMFFALFWVLPFDYSFLQVCLHDWKSNILRFFLNKNAMLIRHIPMFSVRVCVLLKSVFFLLRSNQKYSVSYPITRNRQQSRKNFWASMYLSVFNLVNLSTCFFVCEMHCAKKANAETATGSSLLFPFSLFRCMYASRNAYTYGLFMYMLI